MDKLKKRELPKESIREKLYQGGSFVLANVAVIQIFILEAIKSIKRK